jgi:DNA-binding response OmpR family regulator
MPNKIMLFSADDSLAHVILTCLREAGYKLVHVSQGVGAMESIHAEKPTLIILDLELPDYNSLAIIRALRNEERHERIPVILMGANMREEDVLIGLEVGADLCLLEAFHPQVFVARVRSLVRRIEPAKVY